MESINKILHILFFHTQFLKCGTYATITAQLNSDGPCVANGYHAAKRVPEPTCQWEV